MSAAFWGHAPESSALAFVNLDAGVLLPAVVTEAVAAVHSGGLIRRHITEANRACKLVACITDTCLPEILQSHGISFVSEYDPQDILCHRNSFPAAIIWSLTSGLYLIRGT